MAWASPSATAVAVCHELRLDVAPVVFANVINSIKRRSSTASCRPFPCSQEGNSSLHHDQAIAGISRFDRLRLWLRAALWADGAADFVHDPGIALHEDLWSDARATGDGLGGAARMGGEEPVRHLLRADHGRGCLKLADDRLPVPLVAVLSRVSHDILSTASLVLGVAAAHAIRSNVLVAGGRRPGRWGYVDGCGGVRVRSLTGRHRTGRPRQQAVLVVLITAEN